MVQATAQLALFIDSGLVMLRFMIESSAFTKHGENLRLETAWSESLFNASTFVLVHQKLAVVCAH